jgi:hypothetical protein
MNCAFCHQEVTAARIHIRDECPSCSRDLHICLNCEFYDAGAYQQCRESIKEPVLDKEKTNFCDFFQAAKGGTARLGPEGDVFKKLNDLFR